MNVIGFSGSPRINGNTHRLVSAVLTGAADKGATTAFFSIAELNINGCTACGYCRTHGRCVQKDAMAPIYDKLHEADAVVLGSPVYMWQMSGQTKVFVDRLLPILNTADYTTRLAKRPKLALVFTQGQPDVRTFQTYFEGTSRVLSFLGFTPAGTLVAGGTRAETDVEAQPEVMNKARALGASLI